MHCPFGTQPQPHRTAFSFWEIWIHLGQAPKIGEKLEFRGLWDQNHGPEEKRNRLGGQKSSSWLPLLLLEPAWHWFQAVRWIYEKILIFIAIIWEDVWIDKVNRIQSENDIMFLSITIPLIFYFFWYSQIKIKPTDRMQHQKNNMSKKVKCYTSLTVPTICSKLVLY